MTPVRPAPEFKAPDLTARLSERARRMKTSAIHEILKFTPGRIKKQFLGKALGETIREAMD